MKKTLKEFKEFISKGNVIDMAVGVIIGSAFSKIVTSLVNDVVMPLIGIIIGEATFSNLAVTINNSKILYGSFIQNVVDFLIISMCVFTAIKIINKFKRPKVEETPAAPKIPEDIKLLTEIRDLLKNSNKKQK